ncbi:hypothetical protein [Microlunatus parietis]|uniref:Uncharacterized protein n=1 Tax=Microlunatus parietis TaxID=682979 RepID=A0A7Y9I9K1_9ACTN|nr:hypothetical protein [Microlunatus parietis]NYE72289.1 hypothetical protein [Microlunatus parietis]
MITVALIVALTLLAGLAVMQVLLIAGVPLGSIAWGGRHRVLPSRLRWAAVVALGLYTGFAALLLSRAGVLPGSTLPVIMVLTWILFGYCVLSIVPNVISRSRNERIVQVPVSTLLSASVLIIALGPTG